MKKAVGTLIGLVAVMICMNLSFQSALKDERQVEPAELAASRAAGAETGLAALRGR